MNGERKVPGPGEITQNIDNPDEEKIFRENNVLRLTFPVTLEEIKSHIGQEVEESRDQKDGCIWLRFFFETDEYIDVERGWEAVDTIIKDYREEGIIEAYTGTGDGENEFFLEIKLAPDNPEAERLHRESEERRMERARIAKETETRDRRADERYRIEREMRSPYVVHNPEAMRHLEEQLRRLDKEQNEGKDEVGENK